MFKRVAVLVALMCTVSFFAAHASATTLFYESFEGSAVPPVGGVPPAYPWSFVTTNPSYTWQAREGTTGAPAVEGSWYATCYPDLTQPWVPQDEWLVSPAVNSNAALLKLSGWTYGNPFYDWAYDLKVWIIRGSVINDSDDTPLEPSLLSSWAEPIPFQLYDFPWAYFEYDFSPPAGNFRIGFQYVWVKEFGEYNGSGAEAALDAITLETVAVTPVPEPMTLTFMATGAAMISLYRRRRA